MSAGPIPRPTPESREFWQGAAEGELRLPECTACGLLFFYPRAYCPRCSSASIAWRRMSGKATLSSYVINQRPLPMFETSEPQVIALVTLDEGPRLMTNIVDVAPTPDALELGMRLTVRFDRRGDQALPVFGPEEGSDS